MPSTNFIHNMSKSEENPNGVYFNKRRRIVTLSLILSSLVCFIIILILKPYASNPEIVKQIALIGSIDAIKDSVLVALYLIIATIHDVTFEKIAKLAKQIIKIKK